MTNNKINIFIKIMFVFIVLFLAGSFAYEGYIIRKNDEAYNKSLENLDQVQEEHTSGKTNEESK